MLSMQRGRSALRLTPALSRKLNVRTSPIGASLRLSSFAHNVQCASLGTDCVVSNNNASMFTPLPQRTSTFVRSFSSSLNRQSTPTQLYEKALASGELKEDHRQRMTISRLQELYDELTGARPVRSVTPISIPEPPAPPQRRPSSGLSFLGSMFSSSPSRPSTPIAVAHKPIAPVPKGLYIYGGVGCGKTMMMDMFFESVPKSVPKVRKHFHSFMLETHARLHALRQRAQAQGAEQQTDPLQIIAANFAKDEGRLLCLDEFQVTDVADAMILRELFTALFLNGCVVVSTSNRRPEDLYLNGINRESFLPFITILKHNCDVVAMENLPDYRMMVTAEQGMYHQPLGSAATIALNNTFNSLAAGAVTGPVTVDVMMGRSVTAQRAVRHRVAAFTFDELCNRALGAADYMAIAKNFPCVILSDIPVLYFDQRELIRRFITLLDVLYEHRTRLIMSADAPIQSLFQPARAAISGLPPAITTPTPTTTSSSSSSSSPSSTSTSSSAAAPKFSEDEVFASSRAISRLVEMTSSNYLQSASAHGGSKDTPTSF